MLAGTLTPFPFSTSLEQQPAASHTETSFFGSFGTVSEDAQQFFVEGPSPPQHVPEQHFPGDAASPSQQASAAALVVPS
jgi:hypothetical protein